MRIPAGGPGAAAVLSALICLASCGPPRAPIRAGWSGAGGDVDALLQGDVDALGRLGDLTAEVRIALRRDGVRESATGAVLFRPPDLFRLEVRGPLFQHVLTAVVEGDTLTALAGGQLFQTGSREGLDRFLGIDLAGYDPRWAVLGVVAPVHGADGHVVHPSPDRAVITVSQGGTAGRSRRLWLDLRRGFVDREEIVDDGGRILWSRRLAGHRRLAGTAVYLPTRVLVEGSGSVLELAYERVRIDRGLSREAFLGGLKPEGYRE